METHLWKILPSKGEDFKLENGSWLTYHYQEYEETSILGLSKSPL